MLSVAYHGHSTDSCNCRPFFFQRHCMFLSLSVYPDKLKGSLRFSDKAQLPLSAAVVTVTWRKNTQFSSIRTWRMSGTSHPHCIVFEYLHSENTDRAEIHVLGWMLVIVSHLFFYPRFIVATLPCLPTYFLVYHHNNSCVLKHASKKWYNLNQHYWIQFIVFTLCLFLIWNNGDLRM